MPTDQNSQPARRPAAHRARRGYDRRGTERRTPQQPESGSREQVDVEKIMRDIRARISQRHGVDLTAQQIQELAARRLESILDPRNLKASLLQELRQSAAAADDPS